MFAVSLVCAAASAHSLGETAKQTEADRASGRRTNEVRGDDVHHRRSQGRRAGETHRVDAGAAGDRYDLRATVGGLLLGRASAAGKATGGSPHFQRAGEVDADRQGNAREGACRLGDANFRITPESSGGLAVQVPQFVDGAVVDVKRTPSTVFESRRHSYRDVGVLRE